MNQTNLRLMTKNINISLGISADEYLRIYQGSARFIQAISTEGKRVRFPANILQPFVTREGVYGDFAIVCDGEHRFKRIVRC